MTFDPTTAGPPETAEQQWYYATGFDTGVAAAAARVAHMLSELQRDALDEAHRSADAGAYEHAASLHARARGFAYARKMLPLLSVHGPVA